MSTENKKEPEFAVIKVIAKTGRAEVDWPHLRKILFTRVDKILEEYKSAGRGEQPDIDGESFDLRYGRFRESLEGMDRAPFTVQRMCEILLTPRQYSSSARKFFHSVGKCVTGITRPAKDWSPKDEEESERDDEQWDAEENEYLGMQELDHEIEAVPMETENKKVESSGFSHNSPKRRKLEGSPSSPLRSPSRMASIGAQEEWEKKSNTLAPPSSPPSPNRLSPAFSPPRSRPTSPAKNSAVSSSLSVGPQPAAATHPA